MLVNAAFAGSATWNLNPTSNDWNTAANWTPETVPNDYTDVATFDISNVTNISLSTYVDLAGITFNPGANTYSITGGILLFGSGIINNSGMTQNIVAAGFGMAFEGSTTAGDNVVITAPPGEAGNIVFYFTSNAGSATILVSGSASEEAAAESSFGLGASAANSMIINQAGDESGGATYFGDDSTAANSTIITYAGALVEFDEFSTAASATLIADGGTITFTERSNGDLARVELMNGGLLDIDRPHALPTTIGSLEGDSTGVVLLR